MFEKATMKYSTTPQTRRYITFSNAWPKAEWSELPCSAIPNSYSKMCTQ